MEAWKNAILHNNYAEKQYPAIYLFDDHLEVFSNGNPLRNVSFDEFIIGKSRPINRQLTKIAMNIDITDQTGKGNKDIVEIYGKDVFEIMEHTLTVKIPYNKLAMNLDNVPHDVPHGDLDIIVELIKKNPNVTREDMARAINKTTKTVQRIINKCEFIKYVGSGDKGHWEITE